MKAGYKTTEFWLTLLAVLIGVVLEAGIVGGQWAAILGAALQILSLLGYKASRTAVKSADVKAKAAALSREDLSKSLEG